MAASKLKQILQLEPSSEITFRGPFEHVVTSYLELRNPSDKTICFKVKTTAPKRYCVRPNSGLVEPNGKIKIAIMLQPLDPDSEAEARTKHKFMVQSTIINSDDENIPLDEIWSNAKPEMIMDSKLRCVFHSSGAAAAAAGQQDGDGAGSITDAASKSVSSTGAAPQVSTTTATTTTNITSNTTQQQQQQAEQLSRKSRAPGDGQQPELVNSSTPIASRLTQQHAANTKSSGTFTSLSAAAASTKTANQNLKFDSRADKSIASSHNLTSSFLQPMSDDYKIVLVSLIMLVLGVILGKYII